MNEPRVVEFSNILGLTTSDFEKQAKYLAKIKVAKDRLTEEENKTKARLFHLLQHVGSTTVSILLPTETKIGDERFPVTHRHLVTIAKGKVSRKIDGKKLLELGVGSPTIKAATVESTGSPYLLVTDSERPRAQRGGGEGGDIQLEADAA